MKSRTRPLRLRATSWSRSLVLPATLLLAVGCDEGPTEEELRSMMEEVAKAQVEPAQTKQAELEQALADKETRLATAESRVAELGSQLVGLESQLALAQGRLDELEKEPEKPTPEVRPGRPDPASVYEVTIGDAQVKGSSTALVTIVTWSDFQCPYCNRVTGTIDQVLRDYGSDVRYVFKHNPLGFHPNAMPAAIAAEAAGEQGKFFEMHDKLFANQRDLTEANFVKWARELKLDVKKFKRDLTDPAIKARIEAQQAQGMRLGARGTPAFFINGRFLSGAQPLASFKSLIDEEMRKAEALVASGISRSRVYEETIAEGKTAP